MIQSKTAKYPQARRNYHEWRRTYENVQVTEFLFPVVKADGSPPHSFSQSHCFIVRAIRDKQLPSPARLKTPGRSLARFACTQDHNLRADDIHKYLLS